MRKLLFLAVFFVSGCSMIDTSKIAPGYSEAYKAFSNIIFGYNTDEISIEVINGIPYASALVKIGNGPRGLVILEEMSKNKFTWISADEIYFVTMNGRIIRTAGLENNLIDVTQPDIHSIIDDLEYSQEYFYYNSYDFPELKNLELRAKIKFINRQEVNLLSGNRELRMFEEVIESSVLGWKVSNFYWIDDSNFIWKSIQHISPLIPQIEFEITKKPS